VFRSSDFVPERIFDTATQRVGRVRPGEPRCPRACEFGHVAASAARREGLAPPFAVSRCTVVPASHRWGVDSIATVPPGLECYLDMHIIRWLIGALVVWALSGCASYQGGTADDYMAPRSSPTFRPGMNPNDPRDPTGLTRPLPPNTSPAPPSAQP